MYIRIIYIYIHTFKCTHTHTHTHIYIYICIYVYIFTFILFDYPSIRTCTVMAGHPRGAWVNGVEQRSPQHLEDMVFTGQKTLKI